MAFTALEFCRLIVTVVMTMNIIHACKSLEVPISVQFFVTLSIWTNTPFDEK